MFPAGHSRDAAAAVGRAAGGGGRPRSCPRGGGAGSYTGGPALRELRSQTHGDAAAIAIRVVAALRMLCPPWRRHHRAEAPGGQSGPWKKPP